MPDQFLGDFDISPSLSKQVCHAMTESVPADVLHDTKTLQSIVDMPPQQHVRLERLLPALLSGRKQRVPIRLVK